MQRCLGSLLKFHSGLVGGRELLNLLLELRIRCLDRLNRHVECSKFFR